MPKRTAVAEIVAEYLSAIEPLYASREPANLKSALARLVEPDQSRWNAEALDADELTRKARKLSQNLELSVSYRRGCIARWKRFLAWAVEHEHAKADTLVHFELNCRRFRYRGKREDYEMPGQDEDSGAWALGFGRGPVFDPEAVFADFARVARFLPPVPADLLALLAFTGARPVELLRLRAVDFVFDFFAIDDPSAVAVLRHHKTAHHGRPRFLVFGPKARSILDRHMRPFCPHDWMFPAPTDPTRHATTDWLAQIVRRNCRKHSLPPLKLYDLRRAAATLIRARSGLEAGSTPPKLSSAIQTPARPNATQSPTCALLAKPLPSSRAR